MRYTSPLKVTVPSPYSLAQSCVTDTWGLPCGETARAMSVPSRPDTLRRAARVTGGWYAAGGGAEKIGGPGGNTDDPATDEANPGAAGAATLSVTVVIGVTGAALGAGGFTSTAGAPGTVPGAAGAAGPAGAAGAAVAAFCSVPALIACSRPRTALVTSFTEVTVTAFCARISFLLSRRRVAHCFM